MPQKIITLCYRKIIRTGAGLPWDKNVFEDSYMEFKMQAQNFSAGTGYTSYAQLISNFPNAVKLPAMVTPAITGYVQQLDHIIPDILNTLGRRFLRFNAFQFEIINSDIMDRDKHTVAINFFSEPLLWHDTVDDHLLVSVYDAQHHADGEILTNLLQLQAYLNIHSVKYIA